MAAIHNLQANYNVIICEFVGIPFALVRVVPNGQRERAYRTDSALQVLGTLHLQKTSHCACPEIALEFVVQADLPA